MGAGLSEAAATCCAAREQPSLTFSDGSSKELRAALLRCPALSEPFDLAGFTRLGTLSLAKVAVPSFELPVRREEMHGLPDGGCVAVDWIGEALLPERPQALVLIFPGVGTSVKSGFTSMIAHHLALNCSKAHSTLLVGVAVMQGHDGLPLTSASLVSTGYLTRGDAGNIIERVTDSRADIPIVVVACSQGAAYFTHWAGCNPERLCRSSVVGGLVICHGLSSFASADSVDKSMLVTDYILSVWRKLLRDSPPDPDLLARNLQAMVTSTAGQNAPDSGSAGVLLLEKLAAARSVQEWDSACCPLYGFSDRGEMLRTCDTSSSILSKLQLPLVFLNADNDPVTPSTRLIDEGRIHQVVPNCATLRTALGSHMAWWEGPPWALTQSWVCGAVLDLVIALSQLDPSTWRRPGMS